MIGLAAMGVDWNTYIGHDKVCVRVKNWVWEKTRGAIVNHRSGSITATTLAFRNDRTNGRRRDQTTSSRHPIPSPYYRKGERRKDIDPAKSL
jgi:hypothetical protein